MAFEFENNNDEELIEKEIESISDRLTLSFATGLLMELYNSIFDKLADERNVSIKKDGYNIFLYNFKHPILYYNTTSELIRPTMGFLNQSKFNAIEFNTDISEELHKRLSNDFCMKGTAEYHNLSKCC